MDPQSVPSLINHPEHGHVLAVLLPLPFTRRELEQLLTYRDENNTIIGEEKDRQLIVNGLCDQIVPVLPQLFTELHWPKGTALLTQTLEDRPRHEPNQLVIARLPGDDHAYSHRIATRCAFTRETIRDDAETPIAVTWRILFDFISFLALEAIPTPRAQQPPDFACDAPSLENEFPALCRAFGKNPLIHLSIDGNPVAAE